MNLFATSECPRASAIALDDARVVNQVRETAQLLSTAARRLVGEDLPAHLDQVLYRHAHEHHPVTKWVQSSWEAFSWTLEHGLALHAEYCRRFPKRAAIHTSAIPLHAVLGASRSIVQPRLFRVLHSPPAGLVNCAANRSLGLDFTSVRSTTEAYRMYLAARWNAAIQDGRTGLRRPRWTDGQVPDWFPVALEKAKLFMSANGQPRLADPDCPFEALGLGVGPKE